MRYLLIEACHVHVIIHLHLKFCRDRWSDRTGTLSIVRCPRRGTMRLHILRGMKAEVIMHCIHMHHEVCWQWYIFVIIIEAPTCSYVLIEDHVLYIHHVSCCKEVLI